MSKEHKSGREDKKKPQMTAKEKRVAKRQKKSESIFQVTDLKR